MEREIIETMSLAKSLETKQIALCRQSQCGQLEKKSREFDINKIRKLDGLDAFNYLDFMHLILNSTREIHAI